MRRLSISRAGGCAAFPGKRELVQGRSGHGHFLPQYAAMISLTLGVFYFVCMLPYRNRFSIGVASLAPRLFFLGSVQRLALGIIDEYVGSIRTFVQKRSVAIAKTISEPCIWYGIEEQSDVNIPMNDAPKGQRSLAQMGRYVVVGAFNTLFGYSLFAVLNYNLKGLGSYSYMLASLLSSLIAITAAFLGYKWFVFRTKGNYLKEWIRCVAVYSSGMLLPLAGLPILVPFLRRVMVQRPQAAPYLAAAILAVITVIASFFGHKHISFAIRTRPGAGKPGRSPFLPEE
jgi:putative flippase GtrA